MALASVSTRRELVLRRWSRWRVPTRWGGQLAALVALALPVIARAQLPAPGAGPGPNLPTAADLPPELPPPPLAPAEVTPLTVPAFAPTIPIISRLPADMSVQARGGTLTLLAKNPTSGQLVVVTELPLPGPTFETLHIGGFVYVARGSEKIVVLDVRNPLQPIQVVSFPAGGAVRTLWGGTGSLTVERSDGVTLLFDISDPAHPRYQSVLAAGPAASTESRPLYRPAPPPAPVQEQGQHRMAISFRPFMFFANRSPSPTSGGAMLDFSYQYAKVGGLWWGIEIAPLVYNNYFSGPPAVNTRVWFGYSARRFALGAAMGSGITNDQAWLQFGPLARVGRLDGVHSTLRLTWSALLPLPYPASGEFNLEGPVSQRLGVRYNFTGDSALNGFHTTLGLQFFVGGDHRWRTNVLTTGLGFAYMRTNASSGSAPNVHHPGVIFSFTVEPRW